MAVALDATGIRATGTTNPRNYTGITVGSVSNGALIAIVQLAANSALSNVAASWDSAGTPQSMALIGSSTVTGGSTAWRGCYMFGLVAPTAGNKTLQVTWTGTAQSGSFDAISFSGVDQTGGTTTFYNAATQSQQAAGNTSATIVSATGDYCVEAVTSNGTLSSPNQTQLFVGTLPFAGAQYATGAASVSFTWTNSSTWADVVTAIAAKVSAFSVSVTEAATGSDSVDALATFVSAVTEAASAADTVSLTAILVAGITEAASGGDTISVLATFAPSVTEAASAADNITALANFVAAVAEAATATDTQDAAGSTYGVLVTEAATATDTPSAIATFLASLAEAMIATDAPTAVVTFVATLSEAAVAGDSASGFWTTLAAITEAAAASDTPAATLTFMVALAEAAAANDSVAFAYFANAVLSEAALASDNVSVIMNAIASVAEAASATDAVDGNFPIDAATNILKTLVLHPAFLINR